jgi:hypothetical protein
VADRCTIVEGSGFDAAPKGDGYLLSCLLHAMNEERALIILRRVRESISADGRLLIVERILPTGDAPHFGKLLDLTMLLVTGGRERTQDDFAELLARASFKLSRVVPLPYVAAGIGLSILEATPC